MSNITTINSLSAELKTQHTIDELITAAGKRETVVLTSFCRTFKGANGMTSKSNVTIGSNELKVKLTGADRPDETSGLLTLFAKADEDLKMDKNFGVMQSGGTCKPDRYGIAAGDRVELCVDPVNNVVFLTSYTPTGHDKAEMLIPSAQEMTRALKSGNAGDEQALLR